MRDFLQKTSSVIVILSGYLYKDGDFSPELCQLYIFLKEPSKSQQGNQKISEAFKVIFYSNQNKTKKLVNSWKITKKTHLDNTRLHHELNSMKSISDNGIEVNRLVQYNRSSFMVEISRMPFNKNQHVSTIIQNLILLTKITDFDITQVDVAHITSKRQNPQVMLFDKKSDRTNLFKQRKTFCN